MNVRFSRERVVHRLSGTSVHGSVSSNGNHSHDRAHLLTTYTASALMAESFGSTSKASPFVVESYILNWIYFPPLLDFAYESG